jgi:hypothetical protein
MPDLERERLVEAVEAAMSALRHLDRFPDYSIGVRQAVKRTERAQDALAAYDKEHTDA